MSIRSGSFTIILLGLIAGLGGCQSPIENISFPDDNIQPGSPLAGLLTQTTSLDGSADNSIDNSSCLTVKFPVDVVVNNQPLTINNTNDIEIVKGVLTQHKFDYDSIRITYPIDVILADFTERRVTSQNELNTLRSGCLEGGLDPDIECVDINYPVRFKTYDTVNERAATLEFDSDRELYSYMSNITESDIITMEFPFALTLSDGSTESIESNEVLQSVIENNTESCDEDDILFYQNISPFPYETGSLRLLLTDAPFRIDLVDEANVVIEGIDVKFRDFEDSLLTISEEVFSFDLLDLTNGITATLADLEIPEGAYDEIRLTVTESTVLLKDTRLFNLTIPSGKIKVKLAPEMVIAPSDPMEILLDFDVSQSFVVQGNPDTPAGIQGFLFKPVIKAVNLASTGTLSGNVTDISSIALEGVQISVFAADTLNTTSFTDANGDYTVLGLLPGSYELKAELNGYMEENTSVMIILNETTIANFLMQEN